MKYRALLLFVMCLIFSLPLSAQSVYYTLSMEKPHTHYFEVSMKVSDYKKDEVTLIMPVWTPGSYLIREYPKNVEEVSAVNDKGEALEIVKTRKNRWLVKTGKAKSFEVRYRVYAFEHSVRTSFLDASHGYLNGASVFFFIDELKDKEATLEIKPFKDWKKISTQLKPKDKKNDWVLRVPSYEMLADSPIEIGNHKIYEFKAAGVPHKVAVYGEANYDESRFTDDLKNIVEATTSVFGEHPCKDYIFIVHNDASAYGGLEHFNSTSVIFPRFGYSGKGYNSFLGLMAHEYFHLWNVKRLRPADLKTYDYENEMYTEHLWVAEGITSYYDEHLLVRGGFSTPDEYLGTVLKNITNLENRPGRKVQPVSESSLDAWIKYYRKNENTSNTGVSYYSSGAVYSMLLDLEIMKASKGEQNLDDLMRYMYDEFYTKGNKGYTRETLKTAIEKFTKKDMTDFFENIIYGTKTPDYAKYFKYCGLELVTEKSNTPSFGAKLKTEDGKLIVSSVKRNTTAYEGGVNATDELVAIDGYRVSGSNDVKRIIGMKKVGEPLSVTLTRDGRLITLNIKTLANPDVKYDFKPLENASEEEMAILGKWLLKYAKKP